MLLSTPTLNLARPPKYRLYPGVEEAGPLEDLPVSVVGVVDDRVFQTAHDQLALS